MEWPTLRQYHPGYFGKVGMRYFHKQQNHFWKPIINLDKVHIPSDFAISVLGGFGAGSARINDKVRR